MAQTADFTYHQEEKSKSWCLCNYLLPYPDILIRRIVTNWQFDFSKSWCNPALRNAVGCKNVYTKPWQINALSLRNKKKSRFQCLCILTMNYVFLLRRSRPSQPHRQGSPSRACQPRLVVNGGEL